MNKELMFSSATDLWATPQDFFDALNAEFAFETDVCALPENAKCARYFTPEDDGLAQEWTGTCWCNPPYGREIGKWVQKAAESAENGATVVMLLPARTDTRWFHQYIYGKREIRFIAGRLKFGGSKNSAPFPNMVAVFRPKVGEIQNRREYIEVAAANAIEHLTAENAALQEKRLWQPVFGGGPKREGCYLVTVRHWLDGAPVVREAFWNGVDWLSCERRHEITPRVTHWIPLPEAAEEGEKA